MKVQNESVEEILSLDGLLAMIRQTLAVGVLPILTECDLLAPREQLYRPKMLQWSQLFREASTRDKRSTEITKPRQIWLDLPEDGLIEPLIPLKKYFSPQNWKDWSRWLDVGLRLAKLLWDKQDSVSGKVTEEELQGIKSISDDLSLPLAALRDLYAEYRDTPRVPLRERTIGLPLYYKKKDEGVMGELHLALMPDGEGSLYPAHSLAFVEFEEDFLQAIEAARQSLTSLNTGIPANRDLRWEVRIRETGRIPEHLEGDSCGGAFALGMMALLRGSDAKD